MLWRSHMIVGASSWMALQTLTGPLTGQPLDSRERAIGAMVAAGGSLVCDMDTRDSRLAHSLGLVTQLAAAAIGRAFGGHRHGTHSPIFCAAVAAVCTTALAQPELVHVRPGVSVTAGQLVALAVGYVAASLGVALLLRLRGARAAVTAAVLVAAAAATAPSPGLVAAAFTIGCFSHLLGDGLTPEGVMLAWPFSQRRFSLALIKRTGDRREQLLILATAAVTVAIAGGLL